MQKLRIWATVALTLGVLGLIALFLMFLALVDISHGEENVTGEWLIVRLGLFVTFFVIIATFILTGLVFKYFSDKDKREGPKSD
jgi:NhaP-type Na+/H+ or K+/H+ antiporter